jgi:hypothetical protein
MKLPIYHTYLGSIMPTHHVARAAAVLVAATAVAMPVVHDTKNDEALRECFVEVLAGPGHGDHPTLLSDIGGTNCGCS